MTEETDQDSTALLEMTGEIVSAYLGNTSVGTPQVPDIIVSVHTALRNLKSAEGAVAPEPEVLKAAVPIRRSVTPDYIVCLEDGKKLRMLKRHLRTTYGLSPEEYRVRWGLPNDYPMVAPNYAKQRSDFAKKIGLGRGRGTPKRGRRKTST